MEPDSPLRSIDEYRKTVWVTWLTLSNYPAMESKHSIQGPELSNTDLLRGSNGFEVGVRLNKSKWL